MEQMKARADDARSLTLLRQLRYLESEQGDGAGDSLCAADVDVEELLLASLAAVYADSN